MSFAFGHNILLSISYPLVIAVIVLSLH